MTYQIYQGDVMEWAKGYDGPKFHALFSDWPYNLESITRRFGKPGSVPAKYQNDGAFQRQSRGFMGQIWDQPIAYDPETWLALLPHLLPGAFTASFSHTRTQHRLAMAQENAGYLINPAFYSYHSGQVMEVPAQLGWIYGSGKPNGTRLSPKLDEAKGVVRPDKVNGGHIGKSHYGGDRNNGKAQELDRTVPHVIGKGNLTTGTPITPLAHTWNSYQYGSPIKPEIEPIIIAQKPYDGKPIESITINGSGAYNIAYGQGEKVSGRFPGNLVLTHHPGCRLVGERLIKNNAGSLTGDEPSPPMGVNTYGSMTSRVPYQAKGDEEGYELVPDYDCHPDCPIPAMEAQAEGDKAHYFYQADWSFEVAETLASAYPVYYSGKVTVSERNAGCDSLPLKVRNRVNPGGLEHEPRFAPTLQQNNHPTLKPISLCKWIAGLLLPPAEYAPRRLLVCCSGTGSEMIGALLAGWDEVIGVEMSAAYCEIAESRLAWWSQWPGWGQTDVDVILAASTKEEEAGQLSLFAHPGGLAGKE